LPTFGAESFVFQFAIQKFKDEDIQKYNFACCYVSVETWSLILRVLENRVLRRIFGPKWEEVTGEWRKLHIEELSDMYCSPNIVRVIKSRRMRWAEHVARLRERRVVLGFDGET
jgi:hypothetical protein